MAGTSLASADALSFCTEITFTKSAAESPPRSRAAPLVGRLNDLKAERNFYGGLKEALPQLSDLVDKKIAALPAETP